jgi:hypothetical protein
MSGANSIAGKFSRTPRPAPCPVEVYRLARTVAMWGECGRARSVSGSASPPKDNRHRKLTLPVGDSILAIRSRAGREMLKTRRITSWLNNRDSAYPWCHLSETSASRNRSRSLRYGMLILALSDDVEVAIRMLRSYEDRSHMVHR